MDRITFTLLLFALAPASASAQRFSQCHDLYATGNPGFGLGKEASIDGDLVAAAGSFGGVAFFDLSAPGNAPTDVFLPNVSGFPSNMGQALELEGDRAVVSGLAADDRVLVFDRTAGVWGFDPTPIQAPAPMPGDEFGFDVALGGDWIAVGARKDNTHGSDAGAVHLYRLIAGDWTFQQTIYQPSPAPAAVFGHAVALDGPYLLVGAPNTGVGGATAAGKAHFYELDSATQTWTHATDVISQAPGNVRQFGLTVDLDLEGPTPRAAIAENQLIEVWEQQFGFWLISQRLLGSDVALTSLGIKLDLTGSRLVAAGYSSAAGTGLGAVYSADATGMFSFSKALSPARSFNAQQVASSVAVDGDTVLVGSRAFDVPLGNAGVIQVFQEHDFEYESIGFSGACPCTNSTAVIREEGCRNSRGYGGHLVGCGSDSAAANDFGLIARGLNPNALAIFFSGTDILTAPAAQGDGSRITGGALRRISITVSDTAGQINLGGLIQDNSWPVGQTIAVQAWYRDAGGPCGSGYNVTNGVALTVQP
ncbi:hypothetical protein Poly30_03520 [Planctomycetes bacterium Poly30]|uniref:Cortical protein marker for cell polarity n=1 Tax=Saltatorellus ferox TaxID=2528018 RepID=A0A518EL93_9BACT|nr:hypothetical protein Poly30_03520 [Planctomycetes bacterium Poly30]